MWVLTSWNVIYVTGLCCILFFSVPLYGYIHIYGLCINSSKCSNTEEMYVSLCICFKSVGNFWVFHIIYLIMLSLQFQLYAVFISYCLCVVQLYYYHSSVDCIFLPVDIAALLYCSWQQHGYCLVIPSHEVLALSGLLGSVLHGFDFRWTVLWWWIFYYICIVGKLSYTDNTHVTSLVTQCSVRNSSISSSCQLFFPWHQFIPLLACDCMLLWLCVCVSLSVCVCVSALFTNRNSFKSLPSLNLDISL